MSGAGDALVIGGAQRVGALGVIGVAKGTRGTGLGPAGGKGTVRRLGSSHRPVDVFLPSDALSPSSAYLPDQFTLTLLTAAASHGSSPPSDRPVDAFGEPRA